MKWIDFVNPVYINKIKQIHTLAGSPKAILNKPDMLYSEFCGALVGHANLSGNCGSLGSCLVAAFPVTGAAHFIYLTCTHKQITYSLDNECQLH